MSDLTLTNTLVAGTTENVNHVQQNFTDIRTWANGSISNANLTAGAAIDLSKLAIVPMAHVTHNAIQSVSNNTETTLAFNTERYDTATLHDTVTNNSRLTVATAGVYSIWAAVNTDQADLNTLRLNIRKNGTTVIGSSMIGRPLHSTGEVRAHVFTQAQLAASDYVELRVYQTNDSLAAVSIFTAAEYTPEFGISFVSRVS